MWGFFRWYDAGQTGTPVPVRPRAKESVFPSPQPSLTGTDGSFRWVPPLFVPILEVPDLVISEDRLPALLHFLPKLEVKARAAFTHVRCPNGQADAISEVVAHAWEQFRRTPSWEHLNSTDAFATEVMADVRP